MSVPNATARGRRTLVLITAIFLVPMLLAGILRFADVHPAVRRQKGELLSPPGDLRGVMLKQVDGSAYPWNPIDRRWRVLVPVPANCTDACIKVARDIDTVRQLIGREEDRVDVLWWCAANACDWPSNVHRPSTLRRIAPDAAARMKLPRVDAGRGVPVYVVDPNGFVVLRYAPGSDLAGLRADLSRLLKLR